MNLRKKASIATLTFIGLLNVLNFQNCSSGFQIQDSVKADLAGQLSAPTIKIDVTNPNLNASTSSLNFAVDLNPGAKISSVTCFLTTTTTSGTTTATSDCATGTFDISALVDGVYGLMIQATTVAGVKSEATLNFSVDRTSPILTISTKPAADSNVAQPDFVFTNTDATSGIDKVECALDAADFSACTSPFKPAVALTEGAHTFKIRVTDKAGNQNTPYAYNWNVELSKPTIQIATSLGAYSKVTAAAFTLSSNRTVTFECRLDAADFAACTSAVNLTGLADGSHRFEARATSKAGNFSETGFFSWTVDTVMPVLTVSMTPPALSNQTQPTFSFTSSDALSGVDKVECALDATSFAACTSPYKPAVALTEGSHTLKIRVTDKAGNENTPYAYTWTVELTKPTVQITTTLAPFTSSTSAMFKLSGDRMVSFECRIDAANFAACTDIVNYSSLSVGSHKFDARGTSAAGNLSDTVSFSWTIDTTAPTLTLTSTPALNSNVAQPDFAFTLADASSGVDHAECSLDAAAYITCASPYRPTVPLTEGSHTAKFRVFDKAGNQSSIATYTWIVELTRPTIQLTASPSAISTAKSGSFSITSSMPVATYEFSIDGNSIPTQNPTINYTNLTDGVHTFKARVQTAAGNLSDQLVFTWTIDTAAPSLPLIVAGVNALTNSQNASFAFSASDSGAGLDHFLCSRDNSDASAFVTCDSPQTLSGITEGSHIFYVKAVDRAGNTSATASSAWVVDLTPPVTPTLSLNVGSFTNSKSVTATFSSSDAGSGLDSFTCATDLNVVPSCTSPYSQNGLSEGNHSIQIYAYDRAGNRSNAALKSWSIDLTPPSISISSLNGPSTTLTTADFTLTVTDSGSGLQGSFCHVDTMAESPCTTSAHYDSVAAGDHTFFVRATDQAGNSVTQSYMWTVTAVPIHPQLAGTIFKNRAVDAPTDDYQLKFGIANSTINSVLFSPSFSDPGRICFLLKNGDLKCAGLGTVSDEFDLNSNLVNVPQLVSQNVAKAAITKDGICILKTDATLKCLISTTSPGKMNRVTAQFTASGVSDIKPGVAHQCYLLTTGDLYCWGGNSQGQLGIGNIVDQQKPVLSLSKVTQFLVLFGATCAVSNGDLLCMGSTQYFRIQNIQQLVMSPEVVQSPFLGDTLVGGIGDSSAVCWLKGTDLNCKGWNVFGMLAYANPNQIDPNIGGINYYKGAKKIVTSYFAQCVIDISDDAYCYTEDSNRGAIGSTYLPYPQKTSLQLQLHGVSDIFLSTEMACFKMLTGEFRCMGQITGFQQDPSPMGNGLTWDNQWTKVGEGAEKIALKYQHGCWIDAAQLLTCWGEDSGGMIFPTQVLQQTESGSMWMFGTNSFSSFKTKDVAVGMFYTCALTTAGDITCWGANAQDVTGFYNSNPANFTNTESLPSITQWSTGYFTRNDLKNVKAIAGAESNVCVITSDDRIACWGSAYVYGDGKLGSDARFFDIGGATQISAGQAHFCAVNRANDVYCWGSNQVGQISNDPNISSGILTAPVQIASGTANSIELFPRQTCIHKSSGDIECRGTDLNNNPKQIWKHAAGLSVTSLTFAGARPTNNCIVNSSHQLLCGGSADWGVYGAIASSPPSAPIDASASLAVSDAKLGYQGTSMCVLNTNKQVYCRGLNWHGVTGRNAYYNFPRTVNFQ